MLAIQEFANYFGVSSPTIHAWLRKYNEANKEPYDPKNMQSVFEFFEYLQKQFGSCAPFFSATKLTSYKVLLYICNQNGLLYYFLIAQSHRTCYLSLQQMQHFPIDFQF